MHRPSRSKAALAVALFLAAAGAIAPMETLAHGGSGPTTQAQLTVLIQVAASSRTYAVGSADAVQAAGLKVPGALSQIAQGDAFLATAQADSLNSSFTAGALAARASADAYSSASVSATFALTNAGFTSYAEAGAIAGAALEANSTAGVVADAAQKACLSAAGTQAQACAAIDASLADVRVQLSTAASLLASFRAGASASSTLPRAASAVAAARADINATAGPLGALAAATYPSRASAYVNSTLSPLAASAESAVAYQQSASANLSSFASALEAFLSRQARASTEVEGNSTALAAEVSSVDTASVGVAIGSSQTVASEVQGNLSSLLALVSGLPGSAALVSSIQASLSSTQAFESSSGTAGSLSQQYSGTVLDGFAPYLDEVNASRLQVSSDSLAYVSDLSAVRTDLSDFISLGGLLGSTLTQVLALQSNLNSLAPDASSSSSAVDSSLKAEVGAMASVRSGFAEFSTAVSAELPGVAVPASVASAASHILGAERSRLNSTALAELSGMAASLNLTASAAAAFAVEASSAVNGTVGVFGAAASAISSSLSELEAKAHTLSTNAAAAGVALQADLSAREAALSAGRSDQALAVSDLASLEVASGVSAMAEAQSEFSLASSTY